MRSETGESAARRNVVPPIAGRSLWLAAVWTGAGAAFLCGVVAIVAVAVCWLPAAGSAGSAGSAIRAGLLTFLAALHGGITVDGVGASFVPLGLTLIVVAVAWRAGSGLADAAAELGERDPGRLAGAAAAQLAAFAIAAALIAAFGSLGSSSVPVAAAAIAAALLWLVSGTVAFARGRPGGGQLGERIPDWARTALRIGAAAATAYLAAGALLVAGSLVVHHGAATRMSAQLGGGWSGVPVLLLGLLAAPNAAVAGAGYLAGPGFAVGTGTTVAIGSAPTGTAPAFPLLAALPEGAGPGPAGWVLVVAAPLAAAVGAALIASRRAEGAARWWTAALGGLAAGLFAAVAAWLGGGGIGDGRLATIGVSPWQLGGAVALGTAVPACIFLACAAAYRALRPAADSGDLRAALRLPPPRPARGTSARTGKAPAAERDHGRDQLAG